MRIDQREAANQNSADFFKKIETTNVYQKYRKMADTVSHLIHDTLTEVYGTTEAAAVALADVLVHNLITHLPHTYDRNDQAQQDLKNFAYHLLETTKATNEVLLAALTYSDRYFQDTRSRQLSADDYLIHYRLLLITMLTAYKYINERSVSNKAWTRACDFTFDLEEINEMEREFLDILEYALVVEDPNTQKQWMSRLQEMTMAADGGCDRSRSELFIMTPNASVHSSLNDEEDSKVPSLIVKKAKGWKRFWSLLTKKSSK